MRKKNSQIREDKNFVLKDFVVTIAMRLNLH